MRHALIATGIALAAALLVLAAGNDFHLRILFNICVYLLCAQGMNVLLGYAGQKSLGQAGLFAAGAYGAALLTTRWDLDPWLALILAVGIAGVCGVLIAAPSLRVRGPSLAMVTLAFGIVVEKLVTEAEPFGGAMGIYAIKPLTIWGEPLSMAQWVWLGIALCLVTQLLLANLLTGRHGRAFLSLQADEVAAGAVGVPVLRTKVLAFVIAAVTCGLAGALVAQQNQYINSDFITFHLSVFILLLVLFGGSGSLAGPLLGAVTLTVISALVARWTWIEHFVNGALLLFALYAMPKGLAGAIAGAAARLRRRPDRPQGAAPAASAAVALPVREGQPGEAPLLTAEGVCKSYGGVQPARDVAARLVPGHIHALIGPNGAGKSTFINMLSGIVRPDAGRIAFLGEDLSGAAVHAICGKGIARTFQNLRLFRELSVLDNVLLGQHARMRNGVLTSLLGLPAARREERKARQRVDAILAFLGLSHLAALPAGSLAYGLQRRVELARALATEPHLLLLDEPAAGLNPQETAELGGLLRRIRDQGITILLVEHHMDLVMAISDHVIVLDYGEKIAEGAPAAIQRDPRVMTAYLGTEPDAAPRAAGLPAAAGG
ncbi:branched-chain amino acid ABC transporter ATP-binding protein/permease [Roseomonas hellenica]|uniref:Branched-chain amino acid ABC transporter ATP-binding protein/permease n=1 Tax=Plastoroseomonas hellenica TaxID=2687306 RepID=A0ABS5EXC5_9PROT|nr:branched-chain amino acid ABC transporter ATP-binding protein/permease [Plastoroseomonas hellenica]MBR0664955.1 branched-chain amino acid ABC transporter ATP-binding protein/permease [Plastoroseomonas hellenica]